MNVDPGRRVGESDRKVALVTGASEGFGRELCRLIVADGYDLVAVARGRGRLETLARELNDATGAEVRVRPTDLSDPEQQRALAEEARGLPGLAVVVNNAGFSIVDDFHRIPPESIQQMVALNLAALVTLTHAALNNPDFRRGGALINVGSIGGAWPLPYDAVYSATKAAIHHFSTAVAYEVERNPDMDVHVQIARLGSLRTEWADKAMGPLNAGEERDWMIELGMNDVDAAARSVWGQTQRRSKLMVTDTRFAWLSATLFRLFPRAGMALVHGNFQRERARRTRAT